jgi:flagellar hook-basal body complex protein FliE
MPIDPSFALSGAEWRMPALDDASGSVARGADGTAADGGFGSMLSSSIASLTATQTDAAQASQALAAGTVSDPTSVVMAVERARLSMQLASQIRTKAVEAAQDIFHTQV